jgi:hypothetical protein
MGGYYITHLLEYFPRVCVCVCVQVMIGYNALSQTPRSIKRECIYPEIPRIAHKGSKGFTVSASAQRDLFEPLSLSSHAPETPAQFDVDGMVLAAYDEKLAVTLDGADLVLGGDAQVLFNPDADRVITTRGMTIVLVLKGAVSICHTCSCVCVCVRCRCGLRGFYMYMLMCVCHRVFVRQVPAVEPGAGESADHPRGRRPRRTRQAARGAQGDCDAAVAVAHARARG